MTHFGWMSDSSWRHETNLFTLQQDLLNNVAMKNLGPFH